MEWVETTGRTIEEAKDAALDQLGVDEQDAEFEVVEEPKSGLFGRLRSEARVRARVRPTRPRPKVERRDRKRGRGRAGGDGGGDTSTGGDAARETTDEPVPAGEGGRGRGGGRGGRGARSGGGRSQPPTEGRPARSASGDEGSDMEEAPNLEEQGAVVRDFLEGLVDAFGAEGDVSMRVTDDDAVEVEVAGDDLGLLIGPKGQTLQAVQELARSAVQRDVASGRVGRVRIDIGGYRAQRRAALERFTEQVAQQVRESGTSKALEPMNAADRKVVHDTVNDIDGVSTVSEGEDPRRRVVIVPEEG